MRALTTKYPPNFTSSDEASTYLFKLERATVKIVQRINRKYYKGHRSSFKDGWSPVYAAYKIHLQTILEIRRHLAGQHRRHRWNHFDTAKLGVERFMDLWTSRTAALNIPNEQLDKIRHVTGKGPNYWRYLLHLPTVPMCDLEIKILRHHMHGRLRQELRSAINHHTARRETQRELGRTRQVLKSILGRMGGRKHHEPLFLGTVRESDTMVECTPESANPRLSPSRNK